jgi:hypothetical protein
VRWGGGDGVERTGVARFVVRCGIAGPEHVKPAHATARVRREEVT